jgi:hypothetical protein
MLVAASYENGIVIWVEFYAEDWVITCVSESQGSLLLPDKDLDREGSVHSNGYDLLPIC